MLSLWWLLMSFETSGGLKKRLIELWGRRAPDKSEVLSLSLNSHVNFRKPLKSLSLCEMEIMFPAEKPQSYWGKSYGNDLWLSTSFMIYKLPYTFKAFIHVFTHSPMKLCLILGLWDGHWYGEWDGGSKSVPVIKGMDFEVRWTWSDSELTTLWSPISNFHLANHIINLNPFP